MPRVPASLGDVAGGGIVCQGVVHLALVPGAPQERPPEGRLKRGTRANGKLGFHGSLPGHFPPPRARPGEAGGNIVGRSRISRRITTGYPCRETPLTGREGGPRPANPRAGVAPEEGEINFPQPEAGHLSKNRDDPSDFVREGYNSTAEPFADSPLLTF
jgi:hypothetical protein